MKNIIYKIILLSELFIYPITANASIQPKIINYKVSDYSIIGTNLELENNYIDAMKAYKEAVEIDNDGYAACRIGYLYRDGKNGIDINYDYALKWFLKSHELGYPFGSLGVAMAYMNGEGTNIDYKASYDAVKNVETIVIKLVDSNDQVIGEINTIPYASFWWYTRGIGTIRDLSKARELIRLTDHDENSPFIKTAEYVINQVESSIYVDELYEEYKNKNTFNKKYSDKCIAVKGLVHNIKDTSDSIIVDMISDGYLSRNFGIDDLYSDKASSYEINKFLKDFKIDSRKIVRCTFSKDMNKLVNRLKRGRTAIISGSYKESQDNIIHLDDCDII